MAKTLAAQTLATVVGGTFSRIQFTPDLVPSDIVGTRIYRASKETFDVELGPIMANLVLADEINRAPAKVQSALLEAMAERQVSIGGRSWPVPTPFLVLATQNPIESEGVYQLPEAQRDRFLMKVVVDYPTDADELAILYRMSTDRPSPRRVLDAERLRDLQIHAERVFVHHALAEYVVRLILATRDPGRFGLPEIAPLLAYGASPRATLGLVAAARARRCCTGGSTCCPRTSGSWPWTSWPTGWCSRSTRSPTVCRPRAWSAGWWRWCRRPGWPTGTRSRSPTWRRHEARQHRDGRPRPRRADAGPAAAPPGADGHPTAERSAARPVPWPAARARQRTRRQPRVPAGEDEVRRMDWAVTARTAVPHIRQVDADRELTTWLLVDASASMEFGTAELDKRSWRWPRSPQWVS
ncbi:hypothetical protein GCM10027614_64940 [Micromonospora vulcania]